MNGQSNVTTITDKQAVPPCHFTITCVIGGFPVQLEGDGRAADLKLIIERLQMIGAEPPQAARPTPEKPAGDDEESTPVCPRHHSHMRSGRRGWFCPKKVGDGYCKETA